MALPPPAELARDDVGDDTARLQRLFSDNYRLIWRVVRRLGLPVHAADDAAQQVFLIAAERIDDIRAGSERSFLYGTALRVARSARRKLGREVPGEVDDQTTSPLPRPDELTDQKRAREALDALLAQLPTDLRMAFVLFELEGLTCPEMAEVLEIPLGTVASRLRRAREKFAALVRELTDAAATRGGT